MARTVSRLAVDETTTDELRSLLDDGSEIELELGGSDATTVLLRKRGEIYYCDTSIKLYSYETYGGLVSHLESLACEPP